MALGALISAYQDTSGGGELLATLPLAGRTLVEYQARLAGAVGASPIVLLVERIPPALVAAVDRLTNEGIAVQLARGTREAATFFARDDGVLLFADGLFTDAASVERVAGAARPTVLTIPDNIGLDRFERIDAGHRWAGLALSNGAEVADTAAMLGDWDLQSTLLRRLVQNGAEPLGAGTGPRAPMLLMANASTDLDDAERRLVSGARGARRDWVERWVTPLVEEFAVERLMGTRVRPQWLLGAAVGVTVLAVAFLLMGWRGAGLAALLLGLPLDGAAERLAVLRMQPLARGSRLKTALPWVAAAALAAFGIDLARHEGGWGALATAAAGLGFLRAMATERMRGARPPLWVATRKGCIVLAVPFALTGAWTLGLVAVAAYAGGSFLWLHGQGASRKGLTTL